MWGSMFFSIVFEIYRTPKCVPHLIIIGTKVVQYAGYSTFQADELGIRGGTDRGDSEEDGLFAGRYVFRLVLMKN